MLNNDRIDKMIKSVLVKWPDLDRDNVAVSLLAKTNVYLILSLLHYREIQGYFLVMCRVILYDNYVLVRSGRIIYVVERG